VFGACAREPVRAGNRQARARPHARCARGEWSKSGARRRPKIGTHEAQPAGGASRSDRRDAGAQCAPARLRSARPGMRLLPRRASAPTSGSQPSNQRQLVPQGITARATPSGGDAVAEPRGPAVKLLGRCHCAASISTHAARRNTSWPLGRGFFCSPHAANAWKDHHTCTAEDRVQLRGVGGGCRQAAATSRPTNAPSEFPELRHGSTRPKGREPRGRNTQCDD
jgi:hypothetical protein